MQTTLKVPLFMLAMVLAACRSDPVHYHTLTPLLAGPSRPVQGTGNLTLERLTVPPQVDRAQIVVRQGSNGLAILETEWWGASLADELHSALADQLNQHPFPRKSSLRVQVQRFDLVPGRYARLDVMWRLRTGQPAGPGQEIHCQATFQSPAGVAIESLVTAQQDNLQKVASLISRSANGQCPPP